MIFDPVWSPEWVWLRYATFLRAALLFAIVAAAAALLRRAPASVQAGLWTAALLALLPLPWLRALPVHWSAHVVPAPLAAPMMTIGATMVVQSSAAASSFPWTSAVGVVWVLGVALVLGRLLRAWGTAAVLVARARPVDDGTWLALLREASDALSVGRRIRLLRSAETGVPLTWGTWRPTILLPAEADTWPAAHRRAVLLHELAHVRRLDCLLAQAAHLACALWWFHPGAWWAVRRLRIERERACDEQVLWAGIRPSDYAECLLQIADATHAPRRSGATLIAAGLLSHSELRARLHAILDPGAARGQPRGRAVLGVATMSAVLIVLAVGSMRLSPRPDVLWAALGSGDWATRAYAAESISRFGDARSVAALDATLDREQHPSVRAMARYRERLRARSGASAVRFGWPASTSVP